MTNLERRALLGDRKAQRECTEKGIALPCVHGNECHVFNMEVDGKTVYRVISINCACFQGPMHFTEKEALEQWNTRPAPPIGRCKDCRHLDNTGKHPVCWHTNMPLRTGEDFCSYFEMR